jgi:hypothetical protein
MMHDFFRITEVDSAMQDWDELIHVELKGDNLQQFYKDWDTACLNVRDLPDERFMETLYRKQLSKSESFKNTFALYNQDVAQARDRPDYTKLKNLLRLQLENPRLGRNKNALDRSRTSPTLTPAQKHNSTSKSNTQSGKRPGDCSQWKKDGQCSRGKDCPWSDHTSDKAWGKT